MQESVVVENNALSDIMENKVSGVSQAEKYEKAQQQLETMVEEFKQQHCAGLNADACAAKISAHREELLKGALSFGMDFVPVVGDIKSVAEAQTYIDYLAAMAGIIPVAGDAAAKAIKAAEAALKKGDVAEASRLINKASDEISASNVATYPKLKDDLRQQNLDNIAKQDPRLEAVIKGDNGKLNYGVGSGTKEEADKLGQIWVGDGAKLVSNQKDCPGCLISADGTRIYRPPTAKPNTPAEVNPTGIQANFVQQKDGVITSNGHMSIQK